MDLSKLDSLMNLVGELVIAEAMVTRNPDLDGHEFENLEKASHHLRRITNDLQDVAMSVRMVPLAGTFKKMVRLVHDTAIKAGKKVNLELIGEETEVDKTVIEMISDPLVHIVRNAIDHGLENPEERAQTEKAEEDAAQDELNQALEKAQQLLTVIHESLHNAQVAQTPVRSFTQPGNPDTNDMALPSMLESGPEWRV